MSDHDTSSPWTEDDYDLIEHAVMETDRGRWFLREHGRRNRAADTTLVLNALNKMEYKLSKGTRTPSGLESLRRALNEMADAIHNTKAEVSDNDESEEDASLGGATNELDAIVRSTEKATSDILLSTEQIQEIAWIMREQGAHEDICMQLDSHATDIYAHCSFQDLTGQRIQKVVQTLRFLEGRLHALIDLWGEPDTIGSTLPKMTDFGKPAEAKPETAAPIAAPVVETLAEAEIAKDEPDLTEATEDVGKEEDEFAEEIPIAAPHPELDPDLNEVVLDDGDPNEYETDLVFESAEKQADTVDPEPVDETEIEEFEIELPETILPESYAPDYEEQGVDEGNDLKQVPLRASDPEELDWDSTTNETHVTEESDDGDPLTDAVAKEIATLNGPVSPVDGEEVSYPDIELVTDADEDQADDDFSEFASVEQDLHSAMESHIRESRRDEPLKADSEADDQPVPARKPATLDEIDGWSTARKIAMFS